MPEIRSRGRVVVAKADRLTRRLPQAVGLMFSKPRNLLFEFPKPQRVRLHMFFVFFAIDVVFLDFQKRVVKLKKNLRPFRIHFCPHPSRYVLELKKGTIESADIRVGDTLSFPSA
ncbi:MAG: DUF192 domain-containing protein [Candidatus Aminicenantes bacterium]|nr:DUF192 domain-containing protein [Candidatus Aminicenantes bacterium]